MRTNQMHSFLIHFVIVYWNDGESDDESFVPLVHIYLTGNNKRELTGVEGGERKEKGSLEVGRGGLVAFEDDIL